MFLKEKTDWKCGYKVPNHTYILKGTQCVGYIKEGSGEKVMFPKPLKGFSQTRRSFDRIKDKDYAKS